jgi:4-amino-4-deoxy-L-arabinose transferase-like glycosyltransferase
MGWVSRRAVRTDRTRAAALLWGGWLVVTGLVFSYMDGIIHPYYMVALAPAIAALVGIGGMALWERTLGWPGRLLVAAAVAVTAGWAFVLLDRTPAWYPWLRWLIVVAGALAVVTILAGPWLADRAAVRRGRLGLAAVPVILALVAGLAGPAAYAIETVATTHTGSIPSAGPASAGGIGGAPGGGAPGGRSLGAGAPGKTGAAGRAGATGGTGSRTGTPPGGVGGSGTGTRPGSAGTGSKAPGGGTGRPGGLSGNTQVSMALEKLLEKGASGYKWVAATVGSQEAAPLELATGDAVMAIGGFNGTDPAPTLAQFKAMVATGEIHYYLGANSESFGGGSNSSAITSWVAAHYKKETVGGTTVYDLTQPTSS